MMQRDGAPYVGKFSAEQLAPILEAAAPIPNDQIEEEDLNLGQGKKRTMPRREALIRRLEEIDGIAGIDLEIKDKAAPSVHAKSLHAITAAATDLLEKIGAGVDGGTDQIPRQTWNSLRGAAEAHIARNGVDYRSDTLLRDYIGGIACIADWAKGARKLELRPRRGVENDPWSSDPINNALRRICRMWEEVLGRKIGTAVTADGAAGGPLIRFSISCLTLVLGKVPSEGAIRARIRRLQSGGDQQRRKGRPRKRSPAI